MDKRTPKFESSNKHNPSNTLNTASKVKKSDVDNLLSNELKEYEGDHSNQMPDVKRKLSYNQEDNEFGSQLFTFRQREEESEKSNENASKENEPNADILNEILSLNEKIIQPTFDKSSTYKEHRDILNKLKKFDFPERRLDSELLKFLKYIEKTITPQQQEKMSEYYQLMNGPLLNITNYDDLEEIKLMKRREEFLEKVHDLEDELETVRKEKKLSLFQEELRMAELRNDEFHHLVNERIIMEKNNLSKAEEIRKNEGRSLILENEIKLKKDLISKIDKLLAENQNKKNILEKRKNDIKKLEGEIKSFQNANNQVTQNIEKIQKDNKALETLIQETEKIKDALAELAQKKEKECRGLQDQADKKENENKNIAELNKANLKKIADLDYEIEIISTYNIEKASEKRKMELTEFERTNQEMKRINDNNIFSQKSEDDDHDESRAKFLDVELFKKKNIEFEKSKYLEKQLHNLEETKLGLLKEIQKVSLQPILQRSSAKTDKTWENSVWFFVAFLLLAILLKHVLLIYF